MRLVNGRFLTLRSRAVQSALERVHFRGEEYLLLSRLLQIVSLSVVLLLGSQLLVGCSALAQEKVPVLIHAGGSTYKFSAEIADTAEERGQGLMFREHLGANEGMLFLYPAAKPVSFWMKNTPLPLDMLFIDANGQIINVAAMTKPFDTSPISSAAPAIAVFEIMGGSAGQLGIVAGDKVEWPQQATRPTP